MIYKVGAVYQNFGYLKIEADSKEDLLQKLHDKRFVDELPLPDNENYVDDSFEIDFEGIDDLNDF